MQTNKHSHKQTTDNQTNRQTFRQRLTRLPRLVSHPGFLYRSLEKDCILLLQCLNFGKCFPQHLIFVNKWYPAACVCLAALKSLWAVHNYTWGMIQEQNNNHTDSFIENCFCEFQLTCEKYQLLLILGVHTSGCVSLKKSDNTLNLVVKRDVKVNC